MKATLLLLAVTLFASASAEARKSAYHGNFLICANEENTLKMTADLSDGKNEKVATAVFKEIKEIFPEAQKGKPLFNFSFYPSKKTPLLVTRLGEREPEIRLTVDPEQKEYEVLYDTKEPMIYKMARFKAILSVKSFKVSERQVTCTESKWESN